MATVDVYEFPGDRWYDAREHLWILPEGAEGGGAVTLRIGVDALGQELLGQVVYVELAAAGAAVRRGEAAGSLEAEKMVRPVLAPVSGTILAVNEAVVAAPALVNTDPYGEGWLLRVSAAHWEAERALLLHGAEAVTAWARAEIEANR